MTSRLPLLPLWNRPNPSDAEAFAASRPVDDRIEGHDKYQVELWRDYDFSPSGETRYQIDTYFVVPYSLGIHDQSYSRADFYGDLHSYLRLTPAELSLDQLLHERQSPLVVLERAVSGSTGSEPTHRFIVTNAQLLRANLRQAARRELAELRRQVQSQPDNAAVGKRFENLADSMGDVLGRFRRAIWHLRRPGLPDEQRTLLTLADEALSLVAEESWLAAHVLAEILGEKLPAKAARRRLRTAVQLELEYRARINPSLVLKPGARNERFLERASFLKKFNSKILYLEASRQQEGRKLEQVLYAIAAGVAMVFATGFSYVFQARWEPFTLPIFAALVIGYMCKDRIKESGRGWAGRLLRKRLPDYRTTIRNPYGEDDLGIVRERMRFIRPEDVPGDVWALHTAGEAPPVQFRGSIIRYSKQVVLRPGAFRRVEEQGVPSAGLTDIVRYDIRNYLRRMDDPIQKKLCLAGDKVQKVGCRKVYALEIFSVCQALEPARWQSVTAKRIVLSRKGIERIEDLPEVPDKGNAPQKPATPLGPG